MVHHFTLDLPDWLLLERLKAYLGRDPLSPTQRMDGDVFRFAMAHESATALVAAQLVSGIARCSVSPVSGAPPAGWEASARERLVRLLGLHLDPAPFESTIGASAHAPLIEGRRGLTIPQTHDVLDGLIWVIVGQQVSLTVAFTLRRRIAEHFGRRVAKEFILWPELETIATLDYSDLGRIGFSRRKSEYLIDLARSAVAGDLDLASLGSTPPEEMERVLLGLRGFGPWSVHYLMMRTFGLPDCVPVGDVALAKSLGQYYGLEARPGKAQVLELMAPFAPHRSLATFHLWSRLGEAG